MPNTITEQQEQEVYSNAYKLGHAFVKSIRYDEKDFWASFLMGVLEDKYLELGMPLDKIRVPLRKGAAKAYKVTKDKAVEVKNYNPQYTLAEKQGFSKKQSVSVVSMNNKYYPPVFGHDKDRREELVGVMFFSDKIEKDLHVLPSIIMSYDGGTVNRPYHFDLLEKAQKYFEDKTQNNIWHGSVQSLVDYEINNNTNFKYYNEILARLKWTGESECQIGIFADNLKSRLIAQLRAIDVKNNTEQKFVPISFYIPNAKSEEKVYPYYVEDQATDLELALNDTSAELKAIGLYIYFLRLNNAYNNQQAYDYLTTMLNNDELKESFEQLLLYKNKKITECSRKVILNNIIKIIETKHINANDIDNLELKKLFLMAAICLDYMSKLDDLLDFVDAENTTPLYFAAFFGKQKVIDYILLQPNINYNAVNDYDETILVAAVLGGQEKIVSYLLEKLDIDCNIPENYGGNTPLLLAIEFGNTSIVKLLLSKDNIDCNKANKRNETPLHLAVNSENVEIVMLLLNQDNILANEVDYCDETPLHKAICIKNKSIVEILLKTQKVDYNKVDDNKNTPLHLAVQAGNEEIVQLLLDRHDILCDETNDHKKTPLCGAIVAGNKVMVEMLLKTQKVDCNKAGDNQGSTPLMKAVDCCNQEIVELLLKQPNIDCNKVDDDGFTPLFRAVMVEGIEIINLLLSNPNIEWNKANKYGVTPIVRSIRDGKTGIVKLLLEKVNINTSNNGKLLDLEFLIEEANFELKNSPEKLKKMLEVLNEYKNQKNDNIQQSKSPTLKPRM